MSTKNTPNIIAKSEQQFKELLTAYESLNDVIKDTVDKVEYNFSTTFTHRMLYKSDKIMVPVSREDLISIDCTNSYLAVTHKSHVHLYPFHNSEPVLFKVVFLNN